MSGWGAAAGAAISAGSSLLGGGKDGPDLQPWARVGEGMKRNYFPRANEFADNYSGSDLYQGTTLADQHNATTAAQRQQLDLTGRWNEQTRGAADSIEGFIDYDPNSPVNQMRREAFSEQAMTNFNRNVRPGIEDRGTFGGQFGGPQQALSIGAAGADVARDINSFEAQMADQDRNRALRATGMANDIFAAQNNPLRNKEAIGNRMEARDQLELNDQIMQHDQAYNNDLRNLHDLGSIYDPFSGLSSGGGSQGGTNPYQALVSGAIVGDQLSGDWNPFGGNGGGGGDWNSGNSDWDGSSNGYW